MKRFGNICIGMIGLLALIAAPAHAALVINETDADTPGSDTEEFIEIFETTGTSVSLDGFIVVLFNGNATGDASYLTVNLTGFSTDANGFFVIGSTDMPEADIVLSPGGAGWLQNGVDAVALYNAPAASFPNGTLPTTSSLVDAIVYGTSDPVDNDLLAALGQSTQFDENEFGNGPVTSVGRLPDGTGAFMAGQVPTPGAPNGSAPPVLSPRIALGQVNTTGILIHDINAGTLDRKICVSGSADPFSIIVESLPANGDLFNGGAQVNSVPTTVTANLTYVPDLNYSGLDSFEVSALDSNGTPSSTNALQEVGVQTVGSAFITEIMHSPRLGFDSRAYEWVEVYNPTGGSVSLTRIDVQVETNFDTTNNLPASLGSDAAKIIAADVDTLGVPGISNETLTCEWRMAEVDVLRVPIENWETIRSNPAPAPGMGDPDPCGDTFGDRVLVFGAGGILLDGVDLGKVGSIAGTCRDQSAAIIFGSSFVNSKVNDDDLFWGCVDPLAGFSGVRTGEKTGDLANPLFVDFGEPANPPGLEPSCFGSCCLADGSCDTTGLTQTQCEAICGDFSANPNDCGVCNPDPIGKCCLPFGECQNTSECECIFQAGASDWNGAEMCDFTPNECPVETPPLVINELEANQPGTDTLEFIELKGTPNSSLAGWTLEFFNGANTNAFPPGAISNYRTVDLCSAPGCMVPSSGYLVVGGFGVPDLDIDICPNPGTACSNLIQNSDAINDGVALLFNGFAVQSQSFSYGTGSSFVAAGGDADGTLLSSVGLVDSDTTTLARLPDGGAWKLSCLSTPGAANADGIGACCTGTNSFDCVDDTSCGSCTSNGFDYLGDATTCGPFSCLPTGACCDTTSFACTPDLTQPECELGGGSFLGSNTDCDAFDACFPRGACCVPSGECLDDATELDCTLFGGDWNGEGTTCPDVEGFVACLAGPQVPFDPGCDPFDLDGVPDGDVDLRDFAQFQQDVCASAPTGACCQVDGVCVITNQFDCEAAAGDFRGVGVSCPPVPACEPIPGDILINELLVDEDGNDINEFIELFGTPSASLNGLSILVVDGDTLGDTASQNYRQVTLQLDLDGLQLDSNGFLVIGTGPAVPADVALESIAIVGGNTNGAADELQNGSQTYALVQSADVQVDGSFNKLTQTSVTAINSNAVDTVATVDGGAGDHSYFNAPVVTNLGGGAMAYGHRIPNGVDTNTAADWEALSAGEFGSVNIPTVPTFGAVNQAIVGACCDGITCSQTTFAACGFTFLGFNQSCTPNPCAGACCSPGLACTVTSEANCTAPNSFLGGGTECDPNPCVACTSLEVAEMEADGTSVCITNVLVNTIFDTINSTTSADFTVQDATGTNGITIFGDEDPPEIPGLLDGVAKGDLVEIRGELATFFETRELVSGTTTQLSLVNLGPGTLTPLDRTVGSLQGTALPSSPINNVLVRLKNVQFAPGDQGQAFVAAFNYTVSDVNTAETLVVRINNSNNPPPVVGTTIPSGTVDIVGVVKTFGGAFQVTFFEESDIIPVP